MRRSTNKCLFAVSLAVAITACGGDGEGGSAEPTQGAAIAGPEVTVPGVITPDTLTDTKSLVVASDFVFDTARVIDIDFDLESARGSDATVSICTRFDRSGGAFDVDYGSCAIRAPMTDGVFSHQMEITNEFDSVVAVVWFKDESIEPLHRVFGIDPPMAMATDRGVRAMQDQRRVIVWK